MSTKKNWIPRSEPRSPAERCTLIAGDGSLTQGTRCMLKQNHRGAHVFGCCEYERAALRAAGRAHKQGTIEVFDHKNMPPDLIRALGYDPATWIPQ